MFFQLFKSIQANKIPHKTLPILVLSISNSMFPLLPLLGDVTYAQALPEVVVGLQKLSLAKNSKENRQEAQKYYSRLKTLVICMTLGLEIKFEPNTYYSSQYGDSYIFVGIAYSYIHALMYTQQIQQDLWIWKNYQFLH